MKRHLVIPDCQIRKEDDTGFLAKLAEYICDHKPDTIVCLGDFADMPSLSSYDRGTAKGWNQTYDEDVAAVKDAMHTLVGPIAKESARTIRNKKKAWKPRMVLTLGNHEERIARYANANPELGGTVGYHNLDYEFFGWEVYDYLQPVIVDGVAYCHFMANPMTGRPYSGSAANILQKVGHSFIVGHKQGLEVATRHLPLTGKPQWGIVAGSFYEHDEDYKGYQGNHHWRGFLVLNEVEDGSFDPMFVSLDYLNRKY